jgi:hypothetical protein
MGLALYVCRGRVMLGIQTCSSIRCRGRTPCRPRRWLEVDFLAQLQIHSRIVILLNHQRRYIGFDLRKLGGLQLPIYPSNPPP